MDLKNTEIDQELIDQLRAQIYEFISEHPGGMGIDLDDVRNRIVAPEDKSTQKCEDKLPDLMLRRFIRTLKSGQNLDHALKMFVDTFQFRAQFCPSKMTIEQVFPLEYYHLAAFMVDGTDRQGNKLFILRMKYYRKLPQMDVLVKRGFMYLMEQYDFEFERGLFQGATLLIDLAGFDYLANFNFELLRFIFQGFYHYRGVLSYVLIHQFPWALGWLLKMIESWIFAIRGYDRKLIHLVDKNNIGQYIDDDQRPEFLYGTRPISTQIPANVVPIAEMMKMGELKHLIQEENAALINEFVQEMMNEAESGIN